MPDPVQSTANSCVYDPNLEMLGAIGCDESIATCGPSAAVQREVVTIEPILIQGDAGAQALLKQLDTKRCLSQAGDAVLSCAVTMVAAGGASATGVGLGAALAAASLGAANCARVVTAYDDCVSEQQARREASQACEAKDGLPLLTADNKTLVCLVER